MKSKKALFIFGTFLSFHFQFPPSLLQFFLLFFSIPPPFHFFLASFPLFFPVGEQKFPGQKSGGAHSAPSAPVCYATPPPKADTEFRVYRALSSSVYKGTLSSQTPTCKKLVHQCIHLFIHFKTREDLLYHKVASP